ncbi:hypothetical protein GCM10027061_20520 [Nesterenkonia suensis]
MTAGRSEVPVPRERRRRAEFDRWLAGIIRDAKAEALREFADAMAEVPAYTPTTYDQGRTDQRWQTEMEIRVRADQIETERPDDE